MIVGVVPVVGGSGATSLVLALAALFADRGRAITLVDGDPSGELSSRLRCRPPAPLADLFSWAAEDAAQAKPVRAAAGFDVLPVDRGRFLGCGLASSVATLRASAEACARSSASEDRIVLVDAPPLGTPMASVVTQAVDAVLVAVTESASGARALPPVLRIVAEAQVASGSARRPRLAGVVGTPGRVTGPAAAIAARIAECASGAAPYVTLPMEEEVERAALSGELALQRCAPSFLAALATVADEMLSPRPSRAAAASKRTNGASQVATRANPGPFTV